MIEYVCLSSLFVACLCIVGHLYLTVTAGTTNHPILGRFGSSLHLHRRELGPIKCLRIALSEHGASIYSAIGTACQPDQIASHYSA